MDLPSQNPSSENLVVVDNTVEAVPVVDMDKMNIEVENHFNLDHLRNFGIDLIPYISAAGWIGFFDHSEVVFENQIRDLWKNAWTTSKNIMSDVFGVPVVISEAKIGEAIRCSCLGEKYDSQWEKNFGDENIRNCLLRPETALKLSWSAIDMKG